MWFPGTYNLLRWRIGRLRRKGVPPGRLVEAAAAYVRIRPRDPYGWVIWGNMLIYDDRLDEAEEVLRKGLSQHPRADPLLGCLLADCLRRQSRLEEARAAAVEQLRDFPNSRLPRLRMAELALKERRPEDARRFLDEALARTAPTDANGRREAARLLVLFPEERDRAISILKEATEDLPYDPCMQLELGAALELLGDDEAQPVLRKAESRWQGPEDFATTLDRARRVLRDPRGIAASPSAPED